MPVAMFNGQPVFGPRGPAGPDGNPIGAVISYMGLTAPQDYLICDGTEYQIEEYPQLAKFFESQFGTSSHFGGDGETTFAVPDLRNLFLRGYHGEAEEQLSGDVGEKQAGTVYPYIEVPAGLSQIGTTKGGGPEFVDSAINPYSNIDIYQRTSNYQNPNPIAYTQAYTSRPVNAAVLYCIKAVTSVPPENVYSPEEQVIGRWIDEKPLYRKMLFINATTTNTSEPIHICNKQDYNIDAVVRIYGTVKRTSNMLHSPFPSDCATWDINYINGDIRFICTIPEIMKPDYIAIEYTKTTD